MTHPVTKQEFQDFANEIRGEIAALSEQLRPSSGTVQTVTMPQPLPPPSRPERAAWVAATAAVVALVVVYMQGQRISDMRAEMARESIRREAHEAWAREESNIVRGYIWTGKVPVANKYPSEATK